MLKRILFEERVNIRLNLKYRIFSFMLIQNEVLILSSMLGKIREVEEKALHIFIEVKSDSVA